MKRTKLSVNMMVLIVLILLLGVSALLFKKNRDLKHTLKEKRLELKEAKLASRKLEALEKQSQDLKRKEDSLHRKAPFNEKQPLGLVKKLISIAGEKGLRGMTIIIKEKKETASGAQEEPVQPEPVESGPAPRYLELKFESNFSQLLGFLEQVFNLERIVKVEGISIERKKEVSAYQRVSLELVTYTFLQ